MTVIPMQQRYDTDANWTSVNPVLRVAEIGHETDTGKTKIGDGVTSWTSLSYWNPAGISGSVSSVFGRTGAVTAQSGDYSSYYDTSGAAATAQANAESFATSAVAVETSRAEAAEALKAPLASPAFTGTPTAPTQPAGDTSNAVATDAFVSSAVSAGSAYFLRVFTV